MSSLTIGWEYLTGYVVATDQGDRDHAEWPPHPARVFMAMAAAWFETGEDPEEGKSLRWLETLGDPEMYLPPSNTSSERTKVYVYVPVNDKAGPSSASLQSVPTLTRSKQPRTFSRRYVGHSPCFFHWPQAEGMGNHQKALASLCAKVTRIGHSSSLVHMWIADSLLHAEYPEIEQWTPDDITATAYCRKCSEGMLDYLPNQTQIPRIERFAELVWQIEDAQRIADKIKTSGDAAAKQESKKKLNQAKKVYKDEYGEEYKKSVSPPPRLRPQVGLWTGYRRVDSCAAKTNTAHSHFDTDLLVLTQIDGPRLPVVSTLAVTQALRGAIMQQSGIQPVPDWVSGHQPDGSPCDHEEGHLAILPLPFVGHQHADGHLLGMGLAFPRGIDRPKRGRVLGPLVLNDSAQPRTIELTLGQLGIWVLRKLDWSDKRQTLIPETWTAHPEGKTIWASVTPVVLDRFPKTERGNLKQRMAWEQEVRDIIADGCTRIGLPQPIHIDIDTTSWHVGIPRAIGKRRPLRPENHGAKSRDAALGDGFPFYPAKGTNAPRPQVHVFLQFAEPVIGPILIGAGRYHGYGLFKPLEVC